MTEVLRNLEGEIFELRIGHWCSCPQAPHRVLMVHPILCLVGETSSPQKYYISVCFMGS